MRKGAVTRNQLAPKSLLQMSMITRSEPTTSIVRGRRLGRAGRKVGHGAGAGAGGLGAPEPATRRRREGGPSQDRALYSCQCGLVFNALVSTSVGCPKCGRTQAW